MKRARLFIASLAAVGLAAGCAGIFGIQDLGSSELDGGAVVEASASDASDATPAQDAGMPMMDSSSPCNVVGIVDPPDAAPSGDGGGIVFNAALDYADFGIVPDGGTVATPVGYNLDRFCTQIPGSNSCVATTNGTNFTAYVQDKTAAGMDNAGFDLLTYLGMLGAAFQPANVNARLQEGQFGAVIVVSGYNGEPDDPDVVLDFFPAVGLQGASGNTPVTFGPSDIWTTDSTAHVPSTTGSTFHSIGAYVNGGKLVAPFATIAMTISVSDPDPRLLLSLSDVLMTANIVPTTGSTSAYRLTNGVIAGRWPTRTFFAAVAPLNLSGPVCFNSVVLGVLRSTVCGARDIMATSGQDNTGKTCDSISAALAFDSYSVDSFGQGPPTVVDAGCPDLGDCQ